MDTLLQRRVAVGCMLLGGLFIYDIFWVSCSVGTLIHIQGVYILGCH